MSISKITSAGDRTGTAGDKKSNGSTKGTSSVSSAISLIWQVIRLLVFDGGLFLLFAAFVFTSVVHKLHDDYLHPQLQLMVFQADQRRYTDTTYYHRVCDEDDFTATSPEELIIEDRFTTEETVEHMLKNGVSVYPNLLTNETAHNLREWINHENYRRTSQWGVIEQENRFTWGIDVNDHPDLQTFWQELDANKLLKNGLEGILGPDPAIIEFTAITSSYGAVDQYMHADIMHNGSPVKYARSFAPSYSLFIPLQDTTYEMGATHVCPGTHVCSQADDICIESGAFAVSGEGPGNMWPMGSGALVNQQTFHRGMGFTQEGAIDRIVLIATFAPRPNFRNGLETRQIGQGGSYSLLWNQWGHTFSDYVNADKRMTEPQKTLRSLGLIKGKGWNYISTLSMRMANEDTDMKPDDLEYLLEEEGGLWFLPTSWQYVEEKSDISDFHAFGIGVVKRVEYELKRCYLIGLGVYIFTFFFLVTLQRFFGLGKVSRQSKFSVAFRFFLRLATIHGVIVFFAWFALRTVEESNWAKGIRNRKMYRLPVADMGDPTQATIPYKDDILNVTRHYSSDYLASYTKLIDVAHPGNAHWEDVTRNYAAPYSIFTDSMKKYFCSMLIDEVTTSRRFLKQDEERFWIEVVDMDELVQTCHRDLTTANDPMIDNLISQIDSLQTETIFGKFRSTAMQTKIIPDYLKSWESHFIDEKSIKNADAPPFPTKHMELRESMVGLRRTISSHARAESLPSRDPSLSIRKRALPDMEQRLEPFYGAWLKEGDRVLGLFNCNFENDEWFPGTITAAIPNEGTFDIRYDDGDVGESQDGHCFQRLKTE